MRLPAALRMVGTAYNAWRADNAPQLGAALAYYTLFAMGPVLLVVIAIAGTVFGEQAARGEIVGQIDQLIGPAGAEAVQSILARAGPRSGSSLATVIGIVTFVIAASGAFLQLQSALNRIFRAPQRPRRKRSLLASLGLEVLKRSRMFALLVPIGFVLTVSLAVSAGLDALVGWISGTVVAAPLVLRLLNAVVSLGVFTLLFGVIYRFLPGAKLRLQEVLLGAFLTAVLFTVGKELIGLYLARTATASAFGAAGSVVILLVWVYYSAQIVLFGAEYSRVYIRAWRFRHRRPAAPRAPHVTRSGPSRRGWRARSASSPAA